MQFAERNPQRWDWKERLRSIGRPEPPRVQGLSLFPGMPKLSGNPFENGQSIVENFMKKLPV